MYFCALQFNYSFFFMFDYLQQFNKLPKELKDKVSSPRAMEILSSLEKKYNVNLAMLVMQVMVKQLLFKDLPAHFTTEMGLDLEQGKALTKELQEKIFFSVATYLGLRPESIISPEEKELEQLMKDNNIVLPSQYLLARCRNILLTYRKGVRSKIDARAALEKSVVQGGLGLDSAVAEKLLRLLDGKFEIGKENIKQEIATPPVKLAQSDIYKLINNQEAASAYNLKSTLAKGELKIPEVLADKFKVNTPKLDPSHELEAPDEILSLEAPEEKLEEKNEPVIKNENEPVAIVKEKFAVPADDIKKEVVTTKETVKVENKFEPVSTIDSQDESLSDLAPNKNVNNSFKKPKSSSKDKSNSLFSKLFKSSEKKQTVHVSPLAGMKSNHLEAMVKAASLEAQMKSRPAAASESRPKIEDVKVKPKMMGPLDELRYLDLVNFRRLGNTPEEITKKIIRKIKLLEKDGYDRMIQGVQAWRQSPVNRTYIRLVQDAVNQGLSIDDVLEAKTAEQKETLTKAELIAIVSMNSELMY